ncbi:MAG: hypothetical protein FJ033_08940 [Chloroflexi bacterium]|nr:hypothetical protein [Chloroflexota bacterium]
MARYLLRGIALVVVCAMLGWGVGSLAEIVTDVQGWDIFGATAGFIVGLIGIAVFNDPVDRTKKPQ